MQKFLVFKGNSCSLFLKILTTVSNFCLIKLPCFCLFYLCFHIGDIPKYLMILG